MDNSFVFGWDLSANAANYTWDRITNGILINEGAGPWTGADNWNVGSSNLCWANGKTAIFGVGVSGTAGTVTLSSAVSATGLIFNTPFSGSYTIHTGANNLTLTRNLTANASVTLLSSAGSSLTLGSDTITSLSPG